MSMTPRHSAVLAFSTPRAWLTPAELASSSSRPKPLTLSCPPPVLAGFLAPSAAEPRRLPWWQRKPRRDGRARQSDADAWRALDGRDGVRGHGSGGQSGTPDDSA